MIFLFLEDGFEQCCDQTPSGSTSSTTDLGCGILITPLAAATAAFAKSSEHRYLLR
jgi:hypothetical protein